jgi:hypothetical protein
MTRLFKTVEEAEAFSARARANRVQIKVGDRAVHEGPVAELETRPLPRRAMLPVPTETDECKAFIAWTKLVRYRGRPLYDRVVKIPNDRGKRSVFTAIMVAIGMKKGFPDYVILAPMLSGATLVGGLLLEAKRIKGGKVEAEQLAWLTLLREFGYHAEICAGSVEMVTAVREYMKLAPPGAWFDPTKGVL